MSRTEFAGLKPKKGERVHDMARVPGVEPAWEIPAFVIRGAEAGPTLAITAGIHSAEYAGIAAAMRMAQEIDPSILKGTLIIAPLVNTPGFYERSMYTNPRDGKNINRTFPGKADGSPSEKVTYFLTNELIKGCDAYIDLHGGDMVESLIPFTLFQVTGKDEVDSVSEGIAQAFDLDYIVGAAPDAVPGASYTAAAKLGIPAVITEIGQQGILDSASVERHVRGLANVLIRLGMSQGQEVLYANAKRLSRFEWLQAGAQGAWHPAVNVGQPVEEGRSIGEIRDLFGQPIQELKAPMTGPVLFVVTAMAVRKGDTLLGIGAA
ncbi:MAG: M14 family metallopeptidase [bacterium]